MTSSNLSNHTELQLRIAQLKAETKIQDEVLLQTFKGFVETLNPITMAKTSIHELASDKQVQFDVVKVGLNLGTNFIIEQVLGRQSIKGYLSSVIVEKISSSIINNNINIPQIVSGISQLVNHYTKEESNQP